MGNDSLFSAWLSGGLANAITSAFLNPLDVVKTRMQIFTGGNPTMISTFRHMYRHNNAGVFNGWYRPGLVASCTREMLSSGPRAGLYVPVRDWAMKVTAGLDPESSPSTAVVGGMTARQLVVKLTAAMTTGVVGALIANPVDLVKVRLMGRSHGEPGSGEGLLSALRSIANTEGWGLGGLYRGVVPSTLRSMFIAAGELATYDIAKTAIRQHWDGSLNLGSEGVGSGRSEGVALHIASSLVTGVVAAFVAAPFDLLKTRAMSSCSRQSSATAVPHEPITLRLLFRGVTPAYLRLGPHALLCFPLFEQLRSVMGLGFV